MSDTTFEFSDDFQDTILACAFKHPEKFNIRSQLLQPAYFSGSIPTLVARHLQEFMEHYDRRIPNITVFAQTCYDKEVRDDPDRAREVVAYIQKINELDTDDYEAVFDLMLSFVKERAILAAIRLIYNSTLNQKNVEGGAVALLEKAFNIADDAESIGTLLNKDYEGVIDRFLLSEDGVYPGFSEFRKVWPLGWGPGWLVVPLAPPKRYKSTFIANIALEVASAGTATAGGGGDVLYYACEIGETLTAIRSLCAITGHTQDEAINKPHDFLVAVEGQINNYAGRILIKEFPAKTATVGQIKIHAKTAIRKLNLKPKMIIIDYAETVRPDTEERNRPEHRLSADVYTQARAMGQELKCCVVMPDRCNAETVERAVPSMRSFQGAFEKAGIVDVGIGLCQDEVEYQDGRMRFFVFLNRHGRAGVLFKGKVDKERYRITVDEEIAYNPEETIEENGRTVRRKHGKKVEMTTPNKPPDFIH